MLPLRLARYIPAVRLGARVQERDAKFFCSPVRTATGAPETIAHGMGVVPASVVVVVVDNNGGAAYTVTEGLHTDTDVLVTVTAGAIFKVIVWG